MFWKLQKKSNNTPKPNSWKAALKSSHQNHSPESPPVKVHFKESQWMKFHPSYPLISPPKKTGVSMSPHTKKTCVFLQQKKKHTAPGMNAMEIWTNRKRHLGSWPSLEAKWSHKGFTVGPGRCARRGTMETRIRRRIWDPQKKPSGGTNKYPTWGKGNIIFKSAALFGGDMLVSWRVFMAFTNPSGVETPAGSHHHHGGWPSCRWFKLIMFTTTRPVIKLHCTQHNPYHPCMVYLPTFGCFLW